MHPYHHQGRPTNSSTENVTAKPSHRIFYTEVSPYPRQHRKASVYALAVVNQGKLVNFATTLTLFWAVADATVIALAIRMADKQGTPAYVVSKYKAACRM
ncbi:hypothetical protein HPB50_005801 [Hyalomma asiaticum]|uniref:Uncharacterized protein n=1 Tax=Hyalomma asiaticum TaxID=266040 RepID=A0ACB7RQL7_HYAAI|nr:hypothetical protein HPB50_005801 [Hyalomma asiaticum]